MKEENEIVTLLLFNFNLSLSFSIQLFEIIIIIIIIRRRRRKTMTTTWLYMCTKSLSLIFFSFIPLGFVSKPDIVSLSLPVSTFFLSNKREKKWKKKKEREWPFLDCCLRVLRRERERERERDENFFSFFLSFFLALFWLNHAPRISLCRVSPPSLLLALVWMKFGGRWLVTEPANE